MSKTAGWVPDRQDIIWINCNPQAGNEMRDIHPFLVLSPSIFNEKTGLVIGLPMTTAEYNADNPFAVAVGLAKGRKAGKTSYVLCHPAKVVRLAAARRKSPSVKAVVRCAVRGSLRETESDYKGCVTTHLAPPGLLSSFRA